MMAGRYDLIIEHQHPTGVVVGAIATHQGVDEAQAQRHIADAIHGWRFDQRDVGVDRPNIIIHLEVPSEVVGPITPELTVDPQAFRQHYGPDAELEDDDQAAMDAATDEQIAEALAFAFSSEASFFWDAFDSSCQAALARLKDIIEADDAYAEATKGNRT